MNLLTCLKNFVTIVHCQSFTSAARKLFVSPAKLSKEISWLEGELNTKLLIRSTRQLKLTESGRKLYKKTLKLLNEINELTEIAHDKAEPEGLIRVYLTVTPAIPYLTSLNIQFMSEHNKVEIYLIVGSEIVGLNENQFDVAISFDDIKHPKFICKKLFAIRRALFASPQYLARQGTPKKHEDLLKHNCLINTSYGLQNKWLIGDKVMHVFGNFTSNNASVLKQAALDHLGIIWAPAFSVKKEVSENQLQQILPDQLSPEINLYAIYPVYLAESNKINYLLDFYYNSAVRDGFAVS